MKFLPSQNSQSSGLEAQVSSELGNFKQSFDSDTHKLLLELKIGFMPRTRAGILEFTFDLSRERPTGVNQMMRGQSLQVNDSVSAMVSKSVCKCQQKQKQQNYCTTLQEDFYKRISARAQYPGQLPCYKGDCKRPTPSRLEGALEALQNFKFPDKSSIHFLNQTSRSVCFLDHLPMNPILLRKMLGGNPFSSLKSQLLFIPFPFRVSSRAWWTWDTQQLPPEMLPITLTL